MTKLLNNKLKKTFIIAMMLLLGIVFAGFAEEALYIDDQGNVGIGTTAPGYKLHLKVATGDVGLSLDAPNRQYFIGADDSGSDAILKIGSGSAWQNTIMTLVGATNRVGIGTTSPGAKLHIMGNLAITDPGISTFTIDSGHSFDITGGNAIFSMGYVSGNVGIGTGSPGAKLHIMGNLAITDPGISTFTIDSGHYFNITGGNAIFSMGYVSGNVGIGTASPNRKLKVNGDAGGTTGWYNDSDGRLKKKVKTINNALEKVLKLRGISFEWKDITNHPEGQQIGFIAQEAIDIIPEVVGNAGDTYDMQYAPITALLVEAIKEQQKRIDELEAKLLK